MKHVSYDIAKFIHDLGYDEWTQDLYMFKHTGIRAVKKYADGSTEERIWHEGDLCQADQEWEIKYPSAHWIPAPYVFDAINWLETFMYIKIIPVYTDKNTWSFNIQIPIHLSYLVDKNDVKEHILINKDDIESGTLEETFINALKFIMNLGNKYNWVQKIDDKFKSMADSVIKNKTI